VTTSNQPADNQGTSTAQSLEDQFNAFSHSSSDGASPLQLNNPFKSRTSFVSLSIFIFTLALLFLLFSAALNYTHRTLFDDRKNREILFWRSMPVSEIQNVGSKLFVLYGIAPILILILTLLAGLSCWLLATLVGANENETALQPLLSPFGIYVKIVLAMIALAPVIAWALFSSAFAKKSPLMVSTFLPIGLILADRIVNWATGINLYIRNTIHLYGEFLLQFVRDGKNNIDTLPIGSFLALLAASGVLIVATIWLRNNRYEI
jgi:ABC-2 type transport system permease protein